MGDMRNIVVVPYDPGWSNLFEQEAALLRAAFGQELIAIHHVGSTAIPDIAAKPIIDIMPIVRDIERVEGLDPAIVELGYVPRGEKGIPGRRYFVKGGDETRSHHVHAYEPSNPEVARHLDFRDYLIAHPEEAGRYASLKIELAAEFPNDIWGYMAGKDTFIKETIEKAHKWRLQRTEGENPS